MYGWNGVALRVDLTNKKVSEWQIPTELLADYLGGVGLGTRLLYDETAPKTDPLSPEMLFIMGGGPFTGTLVPSNGRMHVTTKSPLSGILGDSSVGGHFVPQLRWAGYDAIIVTGQADKPLWLWINDGNVELRDASHMWGKSYAEASDMARKEVDDPQMQTAGIGPAAENLVCFSPLFCDASAAAWTSSGTVLGSKKLKLIGARGTRGIEVKDPDGFLKRCREWTNTVRSAMMYPIMETGGVMRIVHPSYQHFGIYQLHNFQEGWLSDEDVSKIDYRGLSQHKRKNMGCALCPLHCKHWLHVKKGKYAGLKGKGIEFLPTVAWAACGVMDSAAQFYLVHLCEELGLCCVHPAYVAQLVMELYERGIITREDTEGLDLTWGNVEAIAELVKKIATREGLGSVLADGYDAAVEKIGKGADRYNTTVKGIPPMTEVRFSWQAALSEVTSTRGGDMLKGILMVEWVDHMLLPDHGQSTAEAMYGFELDAKAFDPLEPYGAPEETIWMENNKAIIDSATCCYSQANSMGYPNAYVPMSVWPQDWGPALTALTGVSYDAKRLYDMGERIYRLQMAYNAREGVRREHFKLRPRFTEDAMTKGPQAGRKIDPKILDGLVDRYLELRGFDPKTALPTWKGLAEVGLEDVARDLKKQGLIEE